MGREGIHPGSQSSSYDANSFPVAGLGCVCSVESMIQSDVAPEILKPWASKMANRPSVWVMTGSQTPLSHCVYKIRTDEPECVSPAGWFVSQVHFATLLILKRKDKEKKQEEEGQKSVEIGSITNVSAERQRRAQADVNHEGGPSRALLWLLLLTQLQLLRLVLRGSVHTCGNGTWFSHVTIQRSHRVGRRLRDIHDPLTQLCLVLWGPKTGQNVKLKFDTDGHSN